MSTGFHQRVSKQSTYKVGGNLLNFDEGWNTPSSHSIMARKKGSGKPSALSDEYVIDSDSDGLAQPDSASSKKPSNGIGSRPSQKKQKNHGTLSSKSPVSGRSSESENHLNDEKNGDGTPSSSSKATSIETVSNREGVAQVKQKLQKKRAASAYEV